MRLFGSFYCNYLKSEVKLIQGLIGGVVYTNRLAFYKFVPCSTETSIETGRTLRHFLHVIGLPHSLHSDNHSNFKQGLFKQILCKFGIPQKETGAMNSSQLSRLPFVETKNHGFRGHGYPRSTSFLILGCCFLNGGG